jgi:hypothetical protein
VAKSDDSQANSILSSGKDNADTNEFKHHALAPTKSSADESKLKKQRSTVDETPVQTADLTLSSSASSSSSSTDTSARASAPSISNSSSAPLVTHAASSDSVATSSSSSSSSR